MKPRRSATSLAIYALIGMFSVCMLAAIYSLMLSSSFFAASAAFGSLRGAYAALCWCAVASAGAWVSYRLACGLAMRDLSHRRSVRTLTLLHTNR